jgi:Flp pilus assembly protein CpaB
MTFVPASSRFVSRRRLLVVVGALALAAAATIAQQKYFESRMPELVPALVAKAPIARGENFAAEKLGTTRVPAAVLKDAVQPQELKGAVAKVDIEPGSLIYRSMVAKSVMPGKNQRIVNVAVSLADLALEVVPNETRVDVLFVPAAADEKSFALLKSVLQDPTKPQVVASDVLVLDVVNARDVSLYKKAGGNANAYEEKVPAAATLLLDVEQVTRVKTCEKYGTLVLAVHPK